MYRKLAFSVVSVLGLMTLIVSAQEPGQSGDAQPRPNFPASPPPGPTSAGAFWPSSVNAPTNVFSPNRDSRSRREENDLIRTSQDLVKQLAKSEGESKDKIKDQLRDTLDKQFDVRQKRHEAELKALEDQVKKLKDMVQKRKENRRDIVGKRLEQLVRETEGLGW